MNRTRLATGAAVLSTALVWQPAALAASLDLAAFGSFQNISAGPEASHQVRNNDPVTDALLLWGETGMHYSSRLGFDGLGSMHKPRYFSADIGTAFQIGELSWLNGTAGHYKTGVNALDLLLSVQLTERALNDFVFGIRIENTRDEGKKGDPDHLKLVHDFGSYRFSAAGGDYVLDFLGLSTDQGASFTDRLSLDEGHKIKAGLYAVISPFTQLPPPDPQAVPVPAAVWLFGSGLAVLAGLARRR
jgi:hypothetical protein